MHNEPANNTDYHMCHKGKGISLLMRKGSSYRRTWLFPEERPFTMTWKSPESFKKKDGKIRLAWDWHGAKMISRYWWAGRCKSWGWDVSRGTGDEHAGKRVCVRYIQVVKTTLGTELGDWFRLGEGLSKKQEERMTCGFLSFYWFFFLSLLLQRNISDCLQRQV